MGVAKLTYQISATSEVLTRGDRLVELKVTMLNIALDVGKCSYITLVKECLTTQVEY